jgi:hypothetical protein
MLRENRSLPSKPGTGAATGKAALIWTRPCSLRAGKRYSVAEAARRRRTSGAVVTQ